MLVFLGVIEFPGKFSISSGEIIGLLEWGSGVS
jgi:hypothetical protein